MSAPSVSVALDKAAYAPGDLVTLTVSYSDADSAGTVVTVLVTDSNGETGAATTSIQVVDPLTVQVSDSGARTWALVSDDGATAVFTATA